MARFKSYNSEPPGGVYFYSLNGEFIQAKSRPAIGIMVKRLHIKHGLPAPPNPFELVMAHMCPSMPAGMCAGETDVRTGLSVTKVKENTRALFGRPVAHPVLIRERLYTCLSCPQNNRSSCPSCSGLMAWVLDGMGNRSAIPADSFAYVCAAHAAFVSALVTVDELGGDIPETCPPACWRRREKGPSDDSK